MDVSSTITFANNLSGATILLTGGEIVLNRYVIIDGSALASGVQINGNNTSRIFFVNSGISATLTGLVLTNGTASLGGAIQNLGTLSLNQCTLAGNRDNCACGINGGAVLNRGRLIANNSTFVGNTAAFGGAIFNDLSSTLAINQSTFSGNIGTNAGGAIYNLNGTMSMIQSTVAANQSPGGGSQGGGHLQQQRRILPDQQHRLWQHGLQQPEHCGRRHAFLQPEQSRGRQPAPRPARQLRRTHADHGAFAGFTRLERRQRRGCRELRP